MSVLRTPDARFAALPDYPFAPHWTTLADARLGALRMHHVDERPPGWRADGRGGTGETVLMLHGEPTWSYLYRRVIPPVVAAGHRAVAPDLIGFGRSDKPARVRDYSYAGHVAWLRAWLAVNDLRDLTLLCQDWGSLLGLRLVASEPERFRRVVLANGGLPTGHERFPRALQLWRLFARWSPVFPIGAIVARGCARPVNPAVVAAYDAPFPDARHKAGARAFPRLIPATPDDPAAADQRAAWAALERFERPFLTAFGDADPITRGADRAFRERVPGAQGQPHTTLERAGHFLQEDAGEALAQVVVEFIARTPATPAPAAAQAVPVGVGGAV